MNLTGQIALVTGANRGLGTHLVAGLLDAGAAKVYATSRSGELPGDLSGDARVRSLTLDITDAASVEAAAATATDVTVLVNNAGVLHFGGVLGADLDGVRADWETNYLGTLRMIQAFVPVLQGQAAAGIVNVLTLIALAPVPGMAGYSASKAATHSLTQALRAEVAGLGIDVLGAYPGGIDTDMLAGVEAEKAPPATVAARIIAALQNGDSLVFPDDASAGAGSLYLTDPLALEKALAG